MSTSPELGSVACPTPDIPRYATPEAAQRHAYGLFGPKLRPYACACGWFHLLPRPPKVQMAMEDVATIGDAVEEMSHRVAALDDAAFLVLTGAEVRGTAAPGLAAALRSGENLARWYRALAVMVADLDCQLHRHQRGQKVNSNWRRRALAVYRLVLQRQDEVQLLAQVLPMSERRNIPSLRRLETERRATAGHRALERLRELHLADFTRLLLEELAELDVPVPNHLKEHAHSHGIETDTEGRPA